MGEININIFPLGNGPCFTQRIFSGQVFHPNKLLTNGNSDNNKKNHYHTLILVRKMFCREIFARFLGVWVCLWAKTTVHCVV